MLEKINLEMENRKKALIIRIYDGFKGNWKLIKRISIERNKEGKIDLFVHNIEEGCQSIKYPMEDNLE